MINLDNLKIVYNSTIEVFDCFLKDSEHPQILKMLDYKNMTCPANLAITDMLQQRKGCITKEHFQMLKDSNFCKKALIILPTIFMLRESMLISKLERYMLCARNGIDIMLGATTPKKSTNKDYKSFERKKLLKWYRRKDNCQSDEDIIASIKKRFTKSERGNALREEMDKIDIDSPYSSKDPFIEYDKLKRLEKEEIERQTKRNHTVQALKKLSDKYVYQYEGVFMLPEVVKMQNKNPEIFDLQELILGFDFQQAWDKKKEEAQKIAQENAIKKQQEKQAMPQA